jgi:hypothetical protein
MGSSLDSRDDRHAYIGYIFEDLNAFVVNLAPNGRIGDGGRVIEWLDLALILFSLCDS